MGLVVEFEPMRWIIMKCCAFTCVFFIPITLSHQTICVQDYKFRNWKFEDHSSPPANLTQNLTVSGEYGNQTIIKVWLKDRTEDFNFTLFADPFVKHEADCPPRLQEHKNLRQFFRTCTVLQNQIESESIPFGNIFTGCYYFIMTNKAGKSWRLNPVYYKTSYRYQNTKLELVTDIGVHPADINTSIRLKTKLRIPLNCLKVRAELYEFDIGIDDPIEDINLGKISMSQADGKISTRCGTSPLITNLTLDVQLIPDAKNEEWTALVVWKRLQPGGGKYYLHFVPNTDACSDHFGYSIDTWRPLVKDIWVPLGVETASNLPHSKPKPNTFPMVAIGVLLAIGTAVIMTYWILQFTKLMIKKGRAHEYSEAQHETVSLCIGKESYEILLLYKKGSHQFMRKMRSFEEALQKHCSEYRVHDVYAMKEWNRVSELGAAGWVDELLKDGSKIIWVDTSDFRSQFNVKEKRSVAQDFRDDAITYAVCVATGLFQNASTQYRRHFVVRVQGYEVDDRDNDPLKGVSPHARYNIPEQFSLLCEHLTTPMKSLKITGDEGVGV